MIDPPDFDRLYGDDPDPWRVATSWYERRKLTVVLAALRREHYARAWDPACGTGHLARALAARADGVLAGDAAVSAVRLAARTCTGLDNVELATHRLPAPPTDAGAFDLVVIAEFLYYLVAEDRRDTLRTVDAVAAAEAELVSLHWRHRPHDAYLSGSDTQTEIVRTMGALGWYPVIHHDDEDFVIDILIRSERSG